MKLIKPLIFLRQLPTKLNKFYSKSLGKSLVITNKLKGKKKFNPVTNLDKAFELFIRSNIQKSFPKDAISGEEYKDKFSNNNFKWSIDPIDGTKAFILGIPTWSNLIGLTYKKTSVLGLANFPELNKFYINDAKNSYVFKNSKKYMIKCSRNKNIKKTKVILNLHQFKNNESIIKFLKKFDLASRHSSFDALSYCLLSEGKIDAVIENNLKPHDIIPLIPIIKNAGGCITDWENKSPENGGNILASSSRKIHKKIIRLLKHL